MLAGMLGDDNDVGARLNTTGTEPDQLVDRMEETSIARSWSCLRLVNTAAQRRRLPCHFEFCSCLVCRLRLRVIWRIFGRVNLLSRLSQKNLICSFTVYSVQYVGHAVRPFLLMTYPFDEI